jgi:hypothetical protein
LLVGAALRAWGAHGEVDIAPETLYELAGGRRAVSRVAEDRLKYVERMA